MTSNVKAGRIIFRVKEVLPSGVLLVEDKDGKEDCKKTKKIVPCHLSIKGTVHSVLAVMLEVLPCFTCGEKK